MNIFIIYIIYRNNIQLNYIIYNPTTIPINLSFRVLL